MKKLILSALFCAVAIGTIKAQDIKSSNVPAVVKEALMKKYPKAGKVTWEKEKGNYEANWGGKSGEDMSVLFTPGGEFVEQVVAIAPSALPAKVARYVKEHYKGVHIKEAGKVTNADGSTNYEAEINGKDLIFDEQVTYLKQD